MWPKEAHMGSVAIYQTFGSGEQRCNLLILTSDLDRIIEIQGN